MRTGYAQFPLHGGKARRADCSGAWYAWPVK